MEVLLEGRKLTKTFRQQDIETKAVCEVDFALNKGEILGIVGESGSGKSTLIRLISGMEKVDFGKLSYRGEDCTGDSPRVMGQRLQVIFQDAKSSFDPRKNMLFSIMEAGHGNVGKAEILKLVEAVGLQEKYLYRKPGELSGGQCQRMAIARALYSGVDILLCDEITSALDVSVQAQVIRLLYEIKETRDLSIIFVTHDIALISMISERVMVMKDGRVIESGMTQEVLRHPQEEYTKILIESAKQQSFTGVKED